MEGVTGECEKGEKRGVDKVGAGQQYGGMLPHLLGRCVKGTTRASLTFEHYRLLNRIMHDEERADCLEATLNVHLQNYAKNVGAIQGNFKRVIEKIYPCEDRISALQQGQKDQEKFNHAILERMREMEEKANTQEECIVSLEEELVTLRWKKACTCGEEGKRTVVVTGSGEPSELEYPDEDKEAESSPDSSYHSPMVAQEEQLLVFGSPAVEEAPILLPSPCACPVPAVIHIEDDVEMTTVPRENERPILSERVFMVLLNFYLQ